MLAGVHRYEIDIAGKRVLEFGCGAGASALILLRDASPPRSFVGVDINESLLAIARMRLAEFGFSEVSEFRAISQNDPLGFIDDESLDVVVASEVFEHIDPKDRQKIVNILWSKLAKGGLLYVTAPSRLSPIDMHTTGLWFTYWLPLGIACDYARLFSRRCRGRTNDQLVADGIRGFSYFELKSLLGSRSFIDMSAVLPLSSPPDERTGPKVLWTKLMWPIYQAVLHRFAPYDAFAPRCVLCFRRE
jgi:SAM-dependent methyltransferase